MLLDWCGEGVAGAVRPVPGLPTPFAADHSVASPSSQACGRRGDRRRAYASEGQMFVDLAQGPMLVMIGNAAGLVPRVRSGEVRALAVTSRDRKPRAAGRADGRGISRASK
ncbi:MAG: hypothetical protein IRZ07_13655 [Microbispora sp.]|nr:hypothetical protein [Microbispora sp.]